MRKTFYIFFTVLFCALTLSGCADLKSKFIRKSKQQTAPKRYIPVREYDVKPSMELYTKRYIFWKNWHKEFMDLVSDQRMTNEKKLLVSIEQEISNLYDMRGMLVDERGDELQLLIDKMAEVEQDMRKQNLTQGNRVRITRTMELLGKEIKDKFSYREVTGEIRDEFRKE
ncbi:MAG TPA: hypothetical protein PKZ41_02235 [Candidatus Omnitrophota bacterium]|nr:hypothetical protein [Candidatus Omnitrophota bacterium]